MKAQIIEFGLLSPTRVSAYYYFSFYSLILFFTSKLTFFQLCQGSSFEHPKRMLKIVDKKILASLRWKFLLIYTGGAVYTY